MQKLNNLGLKTEYKENSKFQKWIKMIFTLALILIDKISDQLEIIMQVEKIEEFTDYFVENYFEGNFSYGTVVSFPYYR